MNKCKQVGRRRSRLLRQGLDELNSGRRTFLSKWADNVRKVAFPPKRKQAA